MQAPLPQPDHQTWHITFGTYATRLHDDPRPTVDRRHNKINTPFPPPDPRRQQQPSAPPLLLTRAQRHHVEALIPRLCTRSNWIYRTCAAAHESDHVHILLDAPRPVHGKQIRQWLKRWLSQSLTNTYGPPARRWWVEGGSTKPVKDPQYLKNATSYINRQRTLQVLGQAGHT